ncbi:MAG: carboxypeptidase-like regulatory domain-containing protein [Acidobacteriia bacterium]|nr:carboxypeptidase-like regulatory domain-containing protein [Terriglobia bacterium]
MPSINGFVKFGSLFLLFGFLLAYVAAVTPAQSAAFPSLHGVVTDPSGALVPGALVQLRGPGGEQRKTTDDRGRYDFPKLLAGKYLVRVIAKGFSVSQYQDFEIIHPTALDVQLTIEAMNQVVNVEDEANKVSVEPDSNGSALVLKEKELESLSDDPDELQQQLQAMAGPGAGPNGGQIYIDGFTGGQLPPKDTIREVRINSNPFSSEYDRPGFGRIEIFTKPGTDVFHGQTFFQFNNQDLNTRSPLLTQSTLPPFKQQFLGVNITGPVKKQKASFGFDFERRDITENAFILATTLDNNFNPMTVNQAVVTPQTRTTFAPRLDLSINTNNTLTLRYQNTRVGSDNQGVGNFNLASMAYNQASTENSLRITETAILNPRMVNETRFQYMRSSFVDSNAVAAPAISVQGAFTSGGATVGDSQNISKRWEVTNISTYIHGNHTFKFGGRARQSFNDDTSLSNFNGTFTFFGGQGPALSSNNQPLAGPPLVLTAIQVYQRTLQLEAAGFSAAQIRALGGGASLFTLAGGAPTTDVSQFDLGMFVNDDFRVRPNLTVSYGFRYEAQTNLGDRGDWSPRLAVAWGIDGRGNNSPKTVLRAGFGIFYDRLSENVTLQSLRFNGVTQQSFLIVNPDFFPAIPSVSSLQAGLRPQQLDLIAQGFEAPRTYQGNIGIERQITKSARISINYINSRGVHLQRVRDVNAPLNGVYPFGDHQARFLTESSGKSRTQQIFVNPNVNFKKFNLFGFYALSYGKDDNEGQPANPYNLRAEWGPSSFADVRHRMVVGFSAPLPLKVTISPFITASSGVPYNITTGRNVFGDGVTAGRPALLAGVGAAGCTGTDLIFEPAFGCFNLNPPLGSPSIERNFGRGPATMNVSLRLFRTWSFGKKAESAGPTGRPDGRGGPRGGGFPRMGGGGGPRGGGGPMVMMGGGGGAAPGMKYNLTLSVIATNALNHANFAPPSGDLSSPFFGQFRSLAANFGPGGGASNTYNRRVSLQLRFTF